MKVVKTTDEYTILERRDGRYAVKNAERKIVNGDDKVAILKAEGLIKVSEPKPAEPEEAAEGGDEAATEEAAAE